MMNETEKGRYSSLKISIVIFAEGLQDDGDDGHDGFDNTELESRLENTLQFRMRHPNMQWHYQGGGGWRMKKDVWTYLYI